MRESNASVSAAATVAKRLPADEQNLVVILRRLAPEPPLLHRLGREEAGRLAARLSECMPPVLDGLDVEEFGAALQSPHGWRAVAALIEGAWVDGHEHLFASPAAGEAAPVPPPLSTSRSGETTLPVPTQVRAEVSPAKQPTRLGERLGIPASRARLLGKARRLGLRGVGDLEELAIARGYPLPGEHAPPTAALAKSVPRATFSDTELTAALLSPCLDYHARAICRGAFLLKARLSEVDPADFVYEARRARGEAVMRHIARIGGELEPGRRRWRDLLLFLPSWSEQPALKPGVMPDEALRLVLTASPRS